jgi:hypothetical protein
MEWWRAAFEKTDKLILAINTIVGLLFAVIYALLAPGINWQQGVVDITIVVVWFIVGYIWGVLNKNLEKINQRVNIWIHEDRMKREKWRELAEKLEDIVKELSKIKDPLEAEIALNGAKEVIKYKGLTFIEFSQILNHLQTCSKFRGIAVYGPGEWMDPFWFAYLIAQASLLKREGVDAQRFFIYPKQIVDIWGNRLEVIGQAIGNTIPTCLCLEEGVNEKLETCCKDFINFLGSLYEKYNEGKKYTKGSFVSLMDIIYIKINETQKICKWRNPGKEGELTNLNLTEISELEKYLDSVCDKLNEIKFKEWKP